MDKPEIERKLGLMKRLQAVPNLPRRIKDKADRAVNLGEKALALQKYKRPKPDASS